MVANFWKENIHFQEDIYVFALNETLLNMSIGELRSIKNLKASYLQLETKNKCVPTDWYLGYDTFMTYSFYQLVDSKGYLKNFKW
jgi:hypothetical protein